MSREREIHLELLSRYREDHDEYAFTELYLLCGPRMLRYAMKHVNDPREAEEAVNDAFVVLSRDFDPRGSASIRSWLRTVVRNKIIDRLRQQRRFEELIRLEQEHEGRFVWASSAPDHESCLAASDEVNKVLEQLPSHHREILLLREIEQWDIRELCEFYEKDAKVVQKRVERARTAFRKIYEQHAQLSVREEVIHGRPDLKAQAGRGRSH